MEFTEIFFDDVPITGIPDVTVVILRFTSAGDVIVNGTRVTVCNGKLPVQV